MLKMTTGFDLNMHMFRLLRREPFFAAISRCISKIPTNAVPTAGVRVNPDTGFFEMMYNPDFFESLGDGNVERQQVEILGVLKHEFYHLLFEHVTGRLPEDGMNRDWNIATDLAINSFIADELPAFAVIPGRSYTDPKTGETNDMFSDMAPYLSAEEYYKILKEKKQEQQEKRQRPRQSERKRER